MAKWLNALAGLIMPDTLARRDVAPAPLAPRMIFGATAAKELCMLPEQIALPDDEEKRVAQIKVDGLNAIYVDNRVIGGREGGPMDCALHCQPGLARLEEHFGHPMVFFGEYSANDGFCATLGEFKAGRGDGVFWIYDAIPHGAWVTGADYLVPIESRLESLRRAFTDAETGLFVGMLDWWMLTPTETRAKAAEIFAAGYEGLVSKKAGSPYRRRRSDEWRKVKARYTADCPVIDTIHNDGKLVKIIVRGPEPTNPKPLTIAGGWSDRQAESIDIGMADGSEGRIVKISFELTVGAARTIRGAKFEELVA